VRYLVTSDLHYALRQLDWIAEQAPEFDAVVLAGDLLDAAGGADLNAQIALFIAYLRRLAGTTVVVANSGNHDLTTRRADGEKAATWMQEIGTGVVTDGGSVIVGSDLVSACAWWEGAATREEVEVQLDREAEIERDGLWIWAYHSPPDRSPTAWSGRRHFGDEVLNALIDRHRPDLVLTGHVHEAPYHPDGAWHDRIGSTTVLNAGRQSGPIPAHLIVDSELRTAAWWTLAGSGEIEL
jgi:Icc-related predicted phosphoesterase